MATRLYLGRESVDPGGPSFTPSAAWEKTTGANLSLRAKVGVNVTHALATTTIAAQGTSGNDTLLNQYISPPLDSNQTITGTVKGQVRMSESAAGLDARAQIIIRVIDSGGTVRGTLLAEDTAALSSEFATSLTNRNVPRGGAVAVTSVAAQTGDRIVIEVGARQHATAAGNVAMSIGDTVSGDLPENQTTTTALAPWVEFSQTITFTNDTSVRATQTSLEVLYEGTPELRSTQVSLDVLHESLAYAMGDASGADALTGTITMSSAVAVGDLILLAVCSDGSATQSWAHDQGFTDVVDSVSGTGARLVIKAIKVGGTFDTTVVITFSASERFSYTLVKIDVGDWSGNLSDIESTVNTGTGTSADPPSLNPSWGATPTMYLAIAGHDDSSDSFTTWSTDYQYAAEATQGGTGANTGILTALKRTSATSDDPSAFTISASEEWIAATIAVKLTDEVGSGTRTRFVAAWWS